MPMKKLYALAAACAILCTASAEARSIRGTLWCANADPECGKDQAPGDVRLGGIEITLCAPDGVTALETTTTAEDGTYAFINLQPKYTVPLGYKEFVVKVTGDAPADKTLGSINCLNTEKETLAVGGCGVVEPIALDTTPCGPANIADASIVIDTSDDADFCDTLVTGIDFVYCGEVVCEGTIGDDVWEDVNEDGIRDADEPPLANVKIILCDETGLEIATTTTDDAGKYLFTDVPCGCYVVKLDESTVLDPELIRCPDGLGQNRENPAASCVETNGEEDLTVDFCFYREPPPPPGDEGCTPGYWKQPHHFSSWVDYSPDDIYDEVFGVTLLGDLTLLQALSQGGGGDAAFGRHSTAALLNAASSVDYGIPTVAELIAFVQAAVAGDDLESQKDVLEALNEAGCPLGRDKDCDRDKKDRDCKKDRDRDCKKKDRDDDKDRDCKKDRDVKKDRDCKKKGRDYAKKIWTLLRSCKKRR